MSNNKIYLIMKKNLSSEKGYVISMVTFFVLMIVLSISLSVSSLTIFGQKKSTNFIKSTRVYYATEAGIEDALMILRYNPQMSPVSYNLTVDGFISNVTIPAIVGGSRVIISQGNVDSISRKIQVVYSIDSEGVSFYYGAHIGAGGLQMSNSSRIIGNVFSNGNITGSSSSTITNNVIVALNGNSISGSLSVGGNVTAYSCLSPVSVTGSVTYVTGGTNTCKAGTAQSNEITAESLPISDQQIIDWKADAENGGTTGSVTLSGSETLSLGPKKIIGNLTISNSVVLTLTGILYVTGNITINNSAKIKLDSSYGSLSGIIIADGTISLNNSSTLQGSGQTGSYILTLSTNTSDTAISAGSSANGAIFYASAGGITASNSFSAREVTAYKLIMNNSATITYESGLASTFFTNGPSGSWKVVSWQEQ